MVQVPTSLTHPQPLKWLAFVRRQIRSSELWLIAVAILVGAAAGALATVQAKLAHGLQIFLFAFDPEQRLSAQAALVPWRVLAIPAGGLVLGLATWAWQRYRPGIAVDPVEANALHGGRMSARDSAFICGQTLISNGAGASVGLEAAYAQAGGAAGSLIGRATYLLATSVTAVQTWPVYGLYALLGLVVAGFGVAMMRVVALADRWTVRMPVPPVLRPALGGLLLAGIALITPQTLSAGHGALALDLEADLGLKLLLTLAAMKAAASIISLSFGFRGGLFFAALFLGTLVGQAFAHLAAYATFLPVLDPTVAALVGMGALGVAIIGGPLTMSFLVLETTGDFTVTAATLVASLIASAVVRETFGYSFSTWRLHLRGETIRSAHDVGWMRTLTAGRMMRKDAPSIPAAADLAEFRSRFPLGGTKRVVLTGADGRYAGLVQTAAAYADHAAGQPLAALAINREAVLTPDLSIKEIMTAFDRAQTDELVVVDEDGRVQGVLSEAYATRRYADELEKARRDLTGEAP